MSVESAVSLVQLRRVRWAVRATLALGVAASVAANVLHARDNLVSETIAAWPPLALLLTIELISRVPVHRRWLAAARMCATAAIAAIAAWVSYWHMASVTARYGESGGAQFLLPLSVDGLVVVASVSLVELAGRIRTADQATPVAASALVPPELPAAVTSTSDTSGREVAVPPVPKRRRRPPHETRAMAEQLLAGEPTPTRAEVAAQLGISTRRLREVLTTDRQSARARPAARWARPTDRASGEVPVLPPQPIDWNRTDGHMTISEVSPLANVVLDGSGGGQVSVGPPSGTKWALRLASVSVSSSARQPACSWYRGSASGPIELIDHTFTGAAASTGKVGGAFFFPGQVLWAVWTGGDASATATLQAFGQQAGRSEALQPAPVGEGADNSTSIIVGNELIATDPDGSYVRIYDQNPGSGAVVDLQPADTPGHTYTPGTLYTDRLPSNEPILAIKSPVIDAGAKSYFYLAGGDPDDTFSIWSSKLISVDTQEAGGSFNINGDVNLGNTYNPPCNFFVQGIADISEKIYSQGSVVCTQSSTSYSKGPAAADSKNNNTFADMKDGAGASYHHTFTKQYGASETDLEVTIFFTLIQQTATSNNFTIQVVDSQTGLAQSIFDSPLINTALNTHTFYAATRRFSGLAANTGARFLTPQWRRDAGTGALVRDANDYLNILAREVPV